MKISFLTKKFSKIPHTISAFKSLLDIQEFIVELNYKFENFSNVNLILTKDFNRSLRHGNSEASRLQVHIKLIPSSKNAKQIEIFPRDNKE